MGRKKKSVLADELAAKLLGLVPPTVAPQHQTKDYKQGWDYIRAEEQRQQIAITRPTAYKQVSLEKIAEKMTQTPAKKGLYAKTLEQSNLQSVELSVATADIELAEGINCIQTQDNSDT